MIVVDLAEYILQRATRENGLSNLELHCYLILIILGYKIEFEESLLDNNPINEISEFGKLGLIVPNIYWKYRNYGANTINVPDRIIKVNDKHKEFIDKTINDLDKRSYWDLQKEKLNINTINL